MILHIDCYLSPDCGAEEGLHENITRALALEGVTARTNYFRIDDEKAVALGLSGSPSVFVNKKELQPQNSVGFS